MFVGCLLLLLGIPLVVCISLQLMWFSAWNVSPSERIRMDAEATAEAIQNARETGRLLLFRSWFSGSKEFFAGKMFEMIRDLPEVRYLYCNGYPDASISAKAVDAVATMPDLEEIHFHIVCFENQALLEMQNMKKLKLLQFWGCKIDGDDLKCLAELKELRILKIYWPLPNDRAGTGEFHQMPSEDQRKIIESLCTLTPLKKLVLEDSFRNDDETLKQHLPETEIIFESIGYDIP